MTYPVNSIADYVIEYAIVNDKHVNNLKLQKILYYLQARFLTEGLGPLFDETIQKWKYGPVVPDVYYRFNHLGAKEIKHVPLDFDFMSLINENSIDHIIEETNEAIEDVRIFDDGDKALIDDTINRLINYGPFYLVDETHKHQSWLRDRQRILSGEKNIPYSDNEIRDDFSGNRDFQLWLER